MNIDDLKRILVECAGEDESVGLDGDILDRSFAELGYDSLALMETAARIKQEFGVTVSDEEVASLETPRMLLELVDRVKA